MTNLRSTVPVLQVSSAEQSCRFYCDQLGFEKNWAHQFEPGLPWFVSISRGPVTLFLSEHPESAVGVLVYVYVEDVDALAQEFEARGAVIDQRPVSRAWGMREMQLSDPDGNRLRLGQDLDDQDLDETTS